MSETPRVAWIAGASGLVGGHLAEALLDDDRWSEVHSLGRRALERQHPRWKHHTVDFDALDTDALPRCDDAFCCIGTTIKKAGSEEAFRAVDHDAVVAFAVEAMAHGAKAMHVVTALGANSGSFSFYNRVKGDVEGALRQLGFASLCIYQPSFLAGDRAENRPGERAVIATLRALGPLVRPFAFFPIDAKAVARAMRSVAITPPLGTRVYRSDELQKLGT